MDAFALLALMAKAKRVFESPGTFLSFPGLSGVSFMPEALRFGGRSEMTADDLLEASEFARVTNQIPKGVLAQLEEGEYLWDVYKDVLTTARVANATPNAAQAAAYEAAIALLYTTDGNGFRTDSDKLRAYKQHRDAHIEAQEEYKNQQLTAETTSDPDLVARWKDEDEPRLRQVVADLEAAWAGTGFKAEVEAAQQVEMAAAGSAVAAIWGEWRSSFLDDLDLQTDTDLLSFAITGYSPSDILDSDWPRFTLSGDEIQRLVAEAPAELREIFAEGTGVSDIDHLSFEYRSVSITRPWFRPALFRSRFWQQPPGAEPLSDGADPPAGRCPAYISAVVFARDVVVTMKDPVGGGHEGSGPAIQMLRLDASMLTPMLALKAKQAEVDRPKRRAAMDAMILRDVSVGASGKVAFDGSRAATRLRAGSFRAAPMVARATPAVATIPAASMSRMRLTREISTVTLATPVVMAPILVAMPPAQPSAPTPEPPPVEPSPVDRTGEIMVLAFICKRVPRSPDPDPSLNWA